MLIEIKKFGKPFENLSYVFIAANIKLLESGINNPFIILNKRARFIFEVFSQKTPWIVKTEKALNVFREKLYKITEIEGLYVRLREAHGRTPSGYITELQVTIPDGDRKLERQIYAAFGELLRLYRPLLFDLHLSKLKNRNPEQVVPEGFWRYEC